MMNKADELRSEAAKREQSAADSFDRCDTDGFLSQWASGLTARELRLQAEIEEADGLAEFRGLFDKDGNRIKAKLVTKPTHSRGTERRRPGCC